MNARTGTLLERLRTQQSGPPYVHLFVSLRQGWVRLLILGVSWNFRDSYDSSIGFHLYLWGGRQFKIEADLFA